MSLVKKGTEALQIGKIALDGYQNITEIRKNLTPPEEQEIQEVTEQEAKEIIAEYKKIQVYHKSKNNDDLGSITSKTSRELSMTFSIATILKLSSVVKWLAGTAIGKGISAGLNSTGVKFAERGGKVISTANETLKWGKVLEDRKLVEMGGSPYMMDLLGNRYFTEDSYISNEILKADLSNQDYVNDEGGEIPKFDTTIHRPEVTYSDAQNKRVKEEAKKLRTKLKDAKEYSKKVDAQEQELRKMYKITDPAIDVFRLHYILTYIDKNFLKTTEYLNFTPLPDGLSDIVKDTDKNLESTLHDNSYEMNGSEYSPYSSYYRNSSSTNTTTNEVGQAEEITYNSIPEPEFTSEIGSDLLAHMPLNVYTSDLSEISTSTSSYPSSSTSGTSTEKKKDKKKKDRKPNLRKNSLGVYS